MANKEQIVEALGQMDPLDDDQWTADGAPKVEVVGKLAGDFGIKRQDIVSAAPAFNRENPVTEIEQDPPEEETETETETSSEEEETETETSSEQETPSEEEDPPEEEASADADLPDVTEREMTEAEFVAWLKKVPSGQLSQIEQDLSEQFEEGVRKMEEMKALHLRVKRARNLTRVRMKQMVPDTSNQESIKNFIRSQNEARAGRVARRQKVLQNIRPEELDSRAPIDAAMARKTKRGTKRPERPIMK